MSLSQQVIDLGADKNKFNNLYQKIIDAKDDVIVSKDDVICF